MKENKTYETTKIYTVITKIKLLEINRYLLVYIYDKIWNFFN